MLTTPADVVTSHTAPAVSAIGVVAAEPRLRRRVVSALENSTVAVAVVADDLDALSEACPVESYDAVVVHLSARREGEGVRSIRAASDAFAGVPLVVVAAGGDSWLRRLLRAGAVGFVREEAVEGALAVTVQAVLAGQTAVPLELGHHVRETALSHRERQILGMVVLGFTNGEIARRFYLAESTVKSHLSASFRKLGVHSRKEAAALILDPDGGLGTGILGMTSGDALRVDEVES